MRVEKTNRTNHVERRGVFGKRTPKSAVFRRAHQVKVARHLRPLAKTVFITGTDTGVGKTMLAALLVAHLRTAGVHALAMKPFCSGSRRDARILRAAQGGELALNVLNPYYFEEAVAPMIAARRAGQKISMEDVVEKIRRIRRRCDVLIIEGAGGILCPLGERWTNLDLVKRLSCAVIVVARNKLGVVNKVLLTLLRLTDTLAARTSIVLMDTSSPDMSTSTNSALLTEFYKTAHVTRVPFLTPEGAGSRQIGGSKKKVKKVLRRQLSLLVSRCSLERL